MGLTEQILLALQGGRNAFLFCPRDKGPGMSARKEQEGSAGKYDHHVYSRCKDMKKRS